MRFRLWILFYIMALLAAALATFGVGGILGVLAVLGFWAVVLRAEDPRQALVGAARSMRHRVC
jgi:hypothetical protein